MKKIVTILILVFTASYTWAQDCTTLWPYVYPEFKQGTLIMQGNKQLESKFNIHVQESKLHYIDNGIIKEAQCDNILLVKIGDDLYMNVDGKVMKVIGSEARGFIATLILGDFDKLNNSAGAYGSSSSSSATTKLASIEIGGKTIVNLMELMQNKENGITIPIKYSYYLVTKGKVIKATKKDIKSQLNSAENEEFKKFLSEHKIKWGDPNSMLTLLDFFNK